MRALVLSIALRVQGFEAVLLAGYVLAQVRYPKWIQTLAISPVRVTFLFGALSLLGV